MEVFPGKGSLTPKVQSVHGIIVPINLLCQPSDWCRGHGGAARQANALEAEGVQVTQNALGEYTVDLTKYGWFPSILPSDELHVASDTAV